MRKENKFYLCLILMGLILIFTAQLWAQEKPRLLDLNAGGMRWDPGTLANMKIFEEKYGVKIDYIAYTQASFPTQKAYLEGVFSVGKSDVTSAEINLIWYVDFAKAGYLSPLDDVLGPEILKKLPKWLVNELTLDGHIYASPNFSLVPVLAYRKDLLEKIGAANPPNTWDELVDQGLKLKKVLPPRKWPYVIHGKIDYWMYHSFLDFLYQAGGRMFDETGKPAFNNAPGVEAVQFIRDLVFKYEIAPPDSFTFPNETTNRMFTQGIVAMDRNWASFAINNSLAPESKVKDVFGVTLLPMNKRRGASMDIWLYGIPANSELVEWGKKYAQFFASYEAEKRNTIVEKGNIPLMPSVLDDLEVKEALPYAPLLKQAVEIAKIEACPHMDQVMEIVAIAVHQAAYGEKTVQKALDDAAQEIYKLLGDWKLK